MRFYLQKMHLFHALHWTVQIIPDLQNCNETERDIWLYDRPHNYVDYAADENGLWAIYVRSGMQHITVSKIEPVSAFLDGKVCASSLEFIG